jgi:hypothetical protein
LLGVTDILDEVCHISRVKVKGPEIWSGCRRAVGHCREREDKELCPGWLEWGRGKVLISLFSD